MLSKEYLTFQNYLSKILDLLFKVKENKTFVSLTNLFEFNKGYGDTESIT